MSEVPHVLTLPGWQNSSPDHWQSRWERVHGCERVEQHDWMRPLRGDWCARLEDALLAQPAPVVLAAHSLGCLLVAPGDAESAVLAGPLPGWAPIVRRALPFPATLVASTDDPYCILERAHGLAASWGADLVVAGAHGHMNAASALGEWPQGWALLQAVAARGADRFSPRPIPT